MQANTEACKTFRSGIAKNNDIFCNCIKILLHLRMVPFLL